MPKSVQFKTWKQIYEHNVDRCTCNFNGTKIRLKKTSYTTASQFQIPKLVSDATIFKQSQEIKRVYLYLFPPDV